MQSGADKLNRTQPETNEPVSTLRLQPPQLKTKDILSHFQLRSTLARVTSTWGISLALGVLLTKGLSVVFWGGLGHLPGF